MPDILSPENSCFVTCPIFLFPEHTEKREGGGGLGEETGASGSSPSTVPYVAFDVASWAIAHTNPASSLATAVTAFGDDLPF